MTGANPRLIASSTVALLIVLSGVPCSVQAGAGGKVAPQVVVSSSAAPSKTVGTPAVRQLLAVEIPMRDGVVLVGDVWLPAAPGRYPLVLHRTPYQRNVDSYAPYDSQIREARSYAERGIAYMIQDVRGRGESGGEYTFFHAEGRDGYDTIEWIAKQPWSNGQVAMLGGSYKGTVQWLAARERPPHLTCLFSQSAVGLPFEEVPYIGGAFQLRWAVSWPLMVSGRLMHEHVANLTDLEPVLAHRPLATIDEALGRRLPVLRSMLAHPTYDDWWREITLDPEHFRGLALPAFHVTGWYDGPLPGQLYYWRQMRAQSAASSSQRLLIGPWTHAETRTGGSPKYNERDRGAASVVDVGTLAFRWFQSCFAGTTATFDAPAARIFMTGANRWLELPDYPVRDAAVRSLYLSAEEDPVESRGGRGVLDWSRPGKRGRAAAYTFDPRDPVPARGTPDRFQIRLDPRDDVLVYTTAPVPEPLAILGPVDLVLHASTSARDTDFVADLYDVDPRGRAMKILFRTAVLRARYREGYDRQVPMPKDRPVELRLKFFDVGHVLLPGHRLRLEVASHTPAINPNQGTGEDVATDMNWVVARQRVYHDAARSSRLELPVIEWSP